MATQNHSYRFDANLEMKDAGLVASSAAAQVDSADKILDLGASSYVEGVVVIDVTAIEVASNDELYDIEFQVSDSATFASNIWSVAVLQLGAAEVTSCDADNSTGRYFLRVANEFDGTLYRYARLYTKVGGSIAGGGGINYSAFLSPR